MAGPILQMNARERKLVSTLGFAGAIALLLAVAVQVAVGVGGGHGRQNATGLCRCGPPQNRDRKGAARPGAARLARRGLARRKGPPSGRGPVLAASRPAPTAQ